MMFSCSPVVIVRRVLNVFLGLISDILFFKKGSQIVILCYHSICSDGWRYSIAPAIFKRQVEYLESKYDFVTLRDLTDFMLHGKVLKRPSVLLTFDDGYKNIMGVKDFLRSKNIKPVVFLVGNKLHLGKDGLGITRERLTETDVKTLSSNGWEFGSHTLNHADLSLTDEEVLRTELSGSLHLLKKDFDVPINCVSYPWGMYDNRTLSGAKEAEYKAGFTMDGFCVNPSVNRYAIPRIGVDRSHTLFEFGQMIKPLPGLLRRLIRKLGLVKYLDYS